MGDLIRMPPGHLPGEVLLRGGPGADPGNAAVIVSLSWLGNFSPEELEEVFENRESLCHFPLPHLMSRSFSLKENFLYSHIFLFIFWNDG